PERLAVRRPGLQGLTRLIRRRPPVAAPVGRIPAIATPADAATQQPGGPGQHRDGDQPERPPPPLHPRPRPQDVGPPVAVTPFNDSRSAVVVRQGTPPGSSYQSCIKVLVKDSEDLDPGDPSPSAPGDRIGSVPSRRGESPILYRDFI